MAESRTQIASRNILYSIMLKAYQLMFPFLIQSLMIYKLGVTYVGLNGLFSSILGILNLTELGFGIAAVYCLYKPVAENNVVLVNAYLNIYKKIYRYIGIAIFLVGMCIIPLLKYLIKSDMPSDVNLYILYVIQLTGAVTSYTFFAYKNSILLAHQKIDWISKIGLVVYTIKFVIQIVAICLFQNYYIYSVAIPVSNLITNFVTAVVVKAGFPQYKCQGELDKKQLGILINKVKALLIVKIGSVVLNSADNLVISVFLGLLLLGKYHNYFYIFSAVTGFVTLLSSAIVPTIGNSLVTEEEQKNYDNFMSISFWNHWIVAWASICMVGLYQPFISIWIGDDNLLPFGIVILLACYFYIMQSHQIAGAYKDAGGIWNEDKIRPLCVALVNLLSNIALVQVIGLYGIVLSTIISLLFINTPWLLVNVHKLILKRSVIAYLKMWSKNIFIFVLTGVIVGILCNLIVIQNKFLQIVICILICMIVPNLLFYLYYYKQAAFRNSKILVSNIADKYIRKILYKS